MAREILLQGDNSAVEQDYRRIYFGCLRFFLHLAQVLIMVEHNGMPFLLVVGFLLI